MIKIILGSVIIANAFMMYSCCVMGGKHER